MKILLPFFALPALFFQTCIIEGTAFGSDYRPLSNSARALGQAGAGEIVGVGDSSAVVANPAAIAAIAEPQATFGFVLLVPSTRYVNSDARLESNGEPIIGNNGGDAGSVTGMPAVFASVPVSDAVTAGIGIHAPASYEHSYSSPWVGRYEAIQSKLSTLSFTPAVSYQVVDSVAIGASVSAINLETSYSRAIDFGSIGGKFYDEFTAATLGLRPQIADGLFETNGDDWGVRYGIGATYQPTDAIRLGVSFLSSVDFSISDTGRISVPTAAEFLTASGGYGDAAVGMKRTLAEEVSIGGSIELNDSMTLYADASYVGSAMQRGMSFDFSPEGSLLVNSQKFDSTWRIASGLAAQYSEVAILRGGIGFASSATSGDASNPTSPGGDRIYLALGASYLIGTMFQLDFGYTHIFVEDVSAQLVSDSGAQFVGDWDQSADMVAASLTAVF